MGNQKSKESAKVLLDLIVQIAQQLALVGIDQDKALTIGKDVAQFIAHYWQGSAIYFSEKQLAVKLLEMELETNFNGSRDEIVFLARKYRITESHTYLLLKQVSERLKSPIKNQ